MKWFTSYLSERKQYTSVNNVNSHINDLSYGVPQGSVLNWKTQYTILRTKLERSIGLLAKLRYFVSANLLRTTYYAIFDLYLCYGCQVWGQNKNGSTNEISALQDKALRVISFKNRNTTAGPLYKEKKVIKFFNLIMFYNCLFVAEHLNQNLPLSFGGYFTYMADCRNHNTRGAVKKLLDLPQ